MPDRPVILTPDQRVRVCQFVAQRGDRNRARGYLAEAQDLAIGSGEGWQVSLIRTRLALIAIDDGRPDEAWVHVRIALDLATTAQEQFTVVVAHYAWAICANVTGDHADARRHLVDGLGLAAAGGDEAALGTFLAALADIESRQGDLVVAVRLAAAAQALRTPSNEMWMRAFVTSWRQIGLDAAAARDRLGAEGYDAAWREGETLGVERAVALATISAAP